MLVLAKYWIILFLAVLNSPESNKPTSAIINIQCIGFSFIGFFFFLAVKLKPMYCDRSAYYQKAIKATARQFIINTNLLWLFLLFGRLIFQDLSNYNLDILNHLNSRNQQIHFFQMLRLDFELRLPEVQNSFQMLKIQYVLHSWELELKSDFRNV